MGFGALAVLGAQRVAGVDLVRDLTGLAEALVGADLVVTGEGSLDEQSLGGKTPMGVAQAALDAGVTVVAVCGVTSLDDARLADAGFARVYRLSDLEPDADRSMATAPALLESVGQIVAGDLAQLRAVGKVYRSTTRPERTRLG
ncbi:hypothetical protein GCM10025865_27530 [Paraoerskovia sediminicola]|uniref:Glycerate kinase n=1 Tax=Paraoerskovia sediminicola TaxID=1138587 RepID=A0ABM8G5M2_9CELL|nr:hypothetical protein GCM10025865_27530 [Paraoerskovia sediminicola]